jgi:Protein of unknown function (DUF3302)
MIGDPFLNYFALGILIFVVVVLFYGIIAIHDIPHIIAKSRNHPHQDAIDAAGWVSLFTLRVLWPFLWIWRAGSGATVVLVQFTKRPGYQLSVGLSLRSSSSAPIALSRAAS